MNTILYTALGASVGGFVAILIYILLNKNIKNLTSEIYLLKKDAEQAVAQKAKAEAAIDRIEYLQKKIDDKEETIKKNIAETIHFKELFYKTEEMLSGKKEEMIKLREQLNNEFKVLANQIFEEKTQKFSKLNEEKLANILTPLKDKIQTFEKKVSDTYEGELRESMSLKEQLKIIIETNRKMSDDAQRLTLALKADKKLQGDWGEMQLEQLLEKSGLQQGIHYHKQKSFSAETGEMRPDYVINLPENKNYIIDSKVSLVRYEQFFNSEKDDEKKELLQRLVKDIDNHIDALSKKKYQELANTPDFVFMYFALEPALFVAMQADLELFNRALVKKVVLVSNTNLLATMRTVSFIWTQESQRKNVQEIAKIGGQLYDKFVLFYENMNRIGDSIDRAKDIHSSAMKQLVKHNADGGYHYGTIVGQAEYLKKLGATASKSLPQELTDRNLGELPIEQPLSQKKEDENF